MNIQISKEAYERVERYAKAFRLDPDALIEAAITMAVPAEIGNTTFLNELELQRRTEKIYSASIR